MIDAVLSVRRAIQARLAADAALAALLGGPGRVHDQPPRGQKGLYVVHGDVEARDWSTGTDGGCEQRLALVVWAASPTESAAALAAAGRVGALLHDAPLEPDGQRCVNLRQTGLDVSRDARSGLLRVVVRLRCVTEQS